MSTVLWPPPLGMNSLKNIQNEAKLPTGFGGALAFSTCKDEKIAWFWCSASLNVRNFICIISKLALKLHITAMLYVAGPNKERLVTCLHA
jgi:hypothetical protein